MYTNSFETGGKFWFGLYKYSMTGLLLSCCTMIGYVAVKEGINQTPFLIPLPFVVYHYWGKTIKTYKRRTYDVPYSKAKEYDAMSNRSEIVSEFDMNCYSQPNLMLPSEMFPNPYRVGNTALLNEKGELNAIYHQETKGANRKLSTNNNSMSM